MTNQAIAYVAQRPMTVIDSVTAERVDYMPGDVVVGFETWDHAVRRAHLDSGNVVMGIPQVVTQARADRVNNTFIAPLPNVVPDSVTHVAQQVVSEPFVPAGQDMPATQGETEFYRDAVTGKTPTELQMEAIAAGTDEAAVPDILPRAAAKKSRARARVP